MRRIFTTLGIVAVLSLSAAPTAFAAPGDQVCADLGSGKIDTTGDPLTVTLVAPAGYVITGYCVKAGSAKQEDGGPEYKELPQSEWAASITISHTSGKAVSHYSYSVIEKAPAGGGNDETPVETPVDETPVETPVDETPVETPVDETPVETPVDETPGNGAQGPEAPGNGAQGPGAPGNGAQGPGAPGNGVQGIPAEGLEAPAQAGQSGQQTANGRAVTNQGLNVQSAGTDASPAQNPLVLGGILALLVTAGTWALRRKLIKQ